MMIFHSVFSETKVIEILTLKIGVCNSVVPLHDIFLSRSTTQRIQVFFNPDSQSLDQTIKSHVFSYNLNHISPCLAKTVIVTPGYTVVFSLKLLKFELAVTPMKPCALVQCFIPTKVRNLFNVTSAYLQVCCSQICASYM